MFTFAREDLIHALENSGYLRIRRGGEYGEIAPMETDTCIGAIERGKVYVPYDFTVWSSLPFKAVVYIYLDDNLWYVDFFSPTKWGWKMIGWLPVYETLKTVVTNTSAVDTLFWRLQIRFLEFDMLYFHEFKRKFLEPLTDYINKIYYGW